MLKHFAVCLALCGLISAPALAADPLQVKLTDDLSRYVTTRASAEHISAASLSISLHGSRRNINAVAGTMLYGGGPPITPATLFQIGSNTKSFTAVTILQLEAAGKLSIDQTLGHWLPQYSAWKNITIRRLLNMTSGIPTYDDVPAFLRAYASNPQRTFTTEQLVAYVYPQGGDPPSPASGWLYSNTAYILLQMIIERATGHSYSSEIHHRFLNGLPATYYARSLYPQPIVNRMVAGYFFNTDPGNEGLAPLLGKDVRYDSMSWAQAAGGIVATPEDLTRWVRLLYQGSILGAPQRREMLTLVSNKNGQPISATSLSDPHGFGLGVGQMTAANLGTFWYYEGMTLGYRMLYAYLPKQDAVIAIGLNSQPPGKQDHIGQLMQSVYKTLSAAGKL